MADFGAVPANVTPVVDVLFALRERDDTLAKWTDGTTDTNMVVGHKRWSTSNARQEYWDGSQWQILDPATYNHVRITSGNPHGVTPAMIGAATKVEFDAFVALRNNPHVVTVAQVTGAASTASLTAHTSRTDNPHLVTTTQIDALNKNNNLSDVASAATALSNIGGASAATLSTHMAALNPHGLSRTDLGAAASGVNADITQLSNVGLVQRQNNHLSLVATGVASRLYLGANAAELVALDSTSNFFPTASGAGSLGTASLGWNTLYFTNKVRNINVTKQTWTFFTYNFISSLNPAVATTPQCADAINSIAQKLDTLGLFN